jgi:uncharacterized small protein (DUF1192 family)
MAVAPIQAPGINCASATTASVSNATHKDVSRTPEDTTMSNGSTLSLPELEDRIAIIRDNIRQLIEQAAANSGAGDEARNADRIAQQNDELERLVKQRDEILKKRGQ